MTQRPIGFSPEEISAQINHEVVEGHAINAAAIWNQWNEAVYAPHYRLKDLIYVEERLEANLDGLRVAFSQGWENYEEVLAQDQPGELFVLVWFSLEHLLPDIFEKALASAEDPEMSRAIVSALGWIPFGRVEDQLLTLVDSQEPYHLKTGIAAYAIHRRNPGAKLLTALEHDNPKVRSRALKAVGELGLDHYQFQLRDCLKDKNDACRFFAAWSLARNGDRSAAVLDILKNIAVNPGLYSDRSAGMAVRCMGPDEAKSWCLNLIKIPESRHAAVTAMGAIGTPDLIPYLIRLMDLEETTRVAGESFSLITGADLVYLDLDRDMPKDEVEECIPKEDAGSVEEAAEIDEEQEEFDDPDEDLPWPHPKRVAEWWEKNKYNFQIKKRYLIGKEITPSHCKDVLTLGYQRQRAAAALELGLLFPGKPMIEIRAKIKK